MAAKISRWSCAVVIVIHCHDLATGLDDRPDVADVSASRVIAKRERISPRLSEVAAQAGVNAERLLARAVDQAQAVAGEAEQAGRIAFTGIGLRGGKEAPS